jgi:hypothetical protein
MKAVEATDGAIFRHYKQLLIVRPAKTSDRAMFPLPDVRVGPIL